jgi:hypothetical protein
MYQAYIRTKELTSVSLQIIPLIMTNINKKGILHWFIFRNEPIRNKTNTKKNWVVKGYLILSEIHFWIKVEASKRY